MSDIDIYMQGRFFTLEDVHSFVKSLSSMEALQPELCSHLVNYLVDLGYDADDLTANLGLKKSTGLIYRLFIQDPAAINNPNFLVHVEDFIRSNLKALSGLQLTRLAEILKKIERFNSNDNDLLGNVEE
jgi:hypothetical protein